MTEIEILSLYLPHNVELFSTTTGKIYKLCANTYNHGSEEVSISSALESGHFKLRLYPLSMLTEEIEHEGKRFVPLDEILKWYSKPYWPKNRPINPIRDWRHKDIQKLLEWHFDVFGLIDQGKAIDKSKL